LAQLAGLSLFCGLWRGLAGRRITLMAQRAIDIPEHIGPVEFGQLGKQIAVRCPKELAHILQRAGAIWEPGSRRWLIERRRIGPVIRALERATDPLFRHAGIALD
jgi:hypothetical protein